MTPWKHTHKYFKRLGDLITFGKIAALCGKELGTAESWARPPESDEHPTGTGKSNPMDCVIRLINRAYPHDPGLAREMAEVFPAYVDSLDERKGEDEQGSLMAMLAVSTREHADILVAASKDGNLSAVFTEYKQFEAVMNQFGAALKQAMKSDFRIKAVENTTERLAK